MKFFMYLIGAVIAVKILGSLFGGDSVTEYPNPSPVVEKAYPDRTQVILFTGTSWCPPCRMLESRVIATKAWKEFANKEISFIAHDIQRGSAQPHQAAELQRYKIQSFPTMLVVDAAGNEISRKSGLTGDLEHYKMWIRMTNS